jgi:hypothetical protein
VGSHCNQHSRVRFPTAYDYVLGLSLFDSTLDSAARERRGDSCEVFFTLPHAVFDHGIEEASSLGGDLSGKFRNIDYRQQLHRRLESGGQMASVGQHLFCRLRNV